MSVNRIDHLQAATSITPASSQVSNDHAVKDGLSQANCSHQNYLPSKPDLRKCPDVCPKLAMNRFIPFVDAVERSQNGILDWGMGKIKDLQVQLQYKTEEHHQDGVRLKTAQDNNSWWAQTGAIAGVAGAAASIVVGTYLLQDPNTSKWISGGMMAAGAASIGSTALNAAGICPLLSGALSLAAGILGLTLGGGAVVEQSLYLENTALSIIGKISSGIQFASAVGSGVRKADLVRENEKFDKNRTLLKEIQQKLQSHCNEAEHLVEMANHLHKSAMEHLKDQIELMRMARSVASAA